MIALSKKLMRANDQLLWWCPGCDHVHAVNGTWGFNGNNEAPTFTPSVLAKTGETVCHSFVENGHMRFLGDCTHAMKNQTVEIPDWPFEV